MNKGRLIKTVAAVSALVMLTSVTQIAVQEPLQQV